MTVETITNLEDTPFIEDIRTDLNERNKGRIAIISGPPGESKSMTAARIGEKVDDDFDEDRIAMGKGSEFITLLKKARDGKFHSGNVLMWDEAGAGMGAREFMTVQNRILSVIFQTIRKLGLLIIMTVPAKRMIDIHGQILMSYYGKAHRIDYNTNRSIFSFYEIVYDDWFDNLKRHNLKDREGKKVDLWYMALPKRIDLDTYEKRKDELLDWLFGRADRIFVQFEKDENNGQGEQFNRYTFSVPIIKHLAKKYHVSESQIAMDFGLDTGNYSRVQRKMTAAVIDDV